MEDSILYINEAKVKKLLDWDTTYSAVKDALISEARSLTIQPPRAIIAVPNGPTLYSMPGFLRNENSGVLACKLVTVADNSKSSKQVPNVIANIAYFSEKTGELLAIIAATEITKWRTAAASLVATKTLLPETTDILAILGSGAQGEIHAMAFHHFFKFKQVRIWNRNIQNAQILVDKLNQSFATKIFTSADSIQECLRNADVIITATNSTLPLVQLKLLKPGAHVNAVGVASGEVHELDLDVYKAADLYVDSKAGAHGEMKTVLDSGIVIKEEIGAVILDEMLKTPQPRVTIFQSLGMAVEDCVMANLIYNRFIEEKNQ